MEEARDLFELAPEEIQVCLRLKGPAGRHQLWHFLRPPAFDDWREYERNLRSRVEIVESEGEEALRFESSTMEAAAALYDRLFRRAEGYRTINGNASLAAETIPLHHKEMVVRGLGDVAPASLNGDADEPQAEALFLLDSEAIEIVLEATRHGTKYRDLVHVFRAPTAAERVEYSRIHSQALYVRDSKTLKSLLPSRLPGLVALYDRLIAQARGYAVADRPLADRAAITKHMDPLHKKVAVQTLLGE